MKISQDPWTNIKEDTRNIMGWPILIAVIDEQDTPPIFSIAPPTTSLSPNLQVGDLILRVHAEDGDKGNPREIRYGLVPDGNQYLDFFTIDEVTGTLKKSNQNYDFFPFRENGIFEHIFKIF